MAKKQFTKKDTETAIDSILTSAGMMREIYAKNAVPIIVVGLMQDLNYAITSMPGVTMEEVIAVLENVVESYKCVVKGENN